MKIEQDLTPVNHTAKGMKQVRGIVLHSMVGTLAGTITWFKNPDAGASAHYNIGKDGRIVQMVKDTDMAWHAGKFDEPIPDFLKPNPNFYTIGIELEDNRDANWVYPEAQRKATAWLVQKLTKDYGLAKDRVFLHKNLNPSRRSDPVGQFSLDWVFATETPSPEPVPDDLTRAINIFKTYRMNRPQGPEGNWEGYANALIGHDRDFPNLEHDLKSAKTTLGEHNSQFELLDKVIDDLQRDKQDLEKKLKECQTTIIEPVVVTDPDWKIKDVPLEKLMGEVIRRIWPFKGGESHGSSQ